MGVSNSSGPIRPFRSSFPLQLTNALPSMPSDTWAICSSPKAHIDETRFAWSAIVASRHARCVSGAGVAFAPSAKLMVFEVPSTARSRMPHEFSLASSGVGSARRSLIFEDGWSWCVQACWCDSTGSSSASSGSDHPARCRCRHCCSWSLSACLLQAACQALLGCPSATRLKKE